LRGATGRKKDFRPINGFGRGFRLFFRIKEKKDDRSGLLGRGGFLINPPSEALLERIEQDEFLSSREGGRQLMILKEMGIGGRGGETHSS